MVKIINDNYLYAKVAKYIDNKSELSEEKLPALTEVVGDEDKAKEIVEAAKASMGKFYQFLLSTTSNAYKNDVCQMFNLFTLTFLQGKICLPLT